MAKTYKAADISIYILSYFRDRKNRITNLKLQKLLYYVQKEFLKTTGDPCFQDKMEAWKLGPVTPMVYHEYSMFLSDPIISFNDYKTLTPEDKKIIDAVLEKHFNTTPWALVDMTHSEEPWINAYRRVDKEITNDAIKKYIYEGRKNER